MISLLVLCRTYSDKMQLVANRVNFKKDPFVDAQYQIEHFNACFSKGSLLSLPPSLPC